MIIHVELTLLCLFDIKMFNTRGLRYLHLKSLLTTIFCNCFVLKVIKRCLKIYDPWAEEFRSFQPQESVKWQDSKSAWSSTSKRQQIVTEMLGVLRLCMLRYFFCAQNNLTRDLEQSLRNEFKQKLGFHTRFVFIFMSFKINKKLFRQGLKITNLKSFAGKEGIKFKSFWHLHKTWQHDKNVSSVAKKIINEETWCGSKSLEWNPHEVNCAMHVFDSV